MTVDHDKSWISVPGMKLDTCARELRGLQEVFAATSRSTPASLTPRRFTLFWGGSTSQVIRKCEGGYAESAPWWGGRPTTWTDNSLPWHSVAAHLMLFVAICLLQLTGHPSDRAAILVAGIIGDWRDTFLIPSVTQTEFLYILMWLWIFGH